MNEKFNSTRELIHDARNQLNRISMQVELAKMLLEQDQPKEKVYTALNKSLEACGHCGEQLGVLAESLAATDDFKS